MRKQIITWCMLIIMTIVTTSQVTYGRPNACAYCEAGTVSGQRMNGTWTDTAYERDCKNGTCTHRKDKKQKREYRYKYTCSSCGYTYYDIYQMEYRWYCCSKHIVATNADSKQ